MVTTEAGLRDVISVFSRGGGHNFDQLPRGGTKYEKKLILRT